MSAAQKKKSMKLEKIDQGKSLIDLAELLLDNGVKYEKVIDQLINKGATKEEAIRIVVVLKQRLKDLVKIAYFSEVQAAIHGILKNRLMIFRDSQSGYTFLHLKNENLVEAVSEDWLAALLTKELDAKKYTLKPKQVREHIEGWVDRTADVVTVMPPSFSLDPNVMAFHHLDIQLADGPTPTWDYLLSKCKINREALMAFSWGILEPQDELQQYVLLYGRGGDGKGSICRFWQHLLTSSSVGLSTKDNYWIAQCVGKRLGIFNDVNNTGIIMSSEFKQVTGGDQVTIMNKYEKGYSTTLDTRLILTTNHSLNISSEESNLRRCIYVPMEPSDKIIEDFEKKLWDERSAFLFKSKQMYEKFYNKARKQIEADRSLVLVQAESYEEYYESIFYKHFELDPKSQVIRREILETVSKDIKGNRHEYKNLKEWMIRTLGIKEERLLDDKRTWVYNGIKKKDSISQK